MRSPNNLYSWSFKQMRQKDFRAMESWLRLETYLRESPRDNIPADPDSLDFEVLKKIYKDFPKDTEALRQRLRVKEMFKRWLNDADPELSRTLSEQLTPRSIVDVYSNIPPIALQLVKPTLKDFDDLLGNRLEPFNQILCGRHDFYSDVSVQLSAQLNEYVPPLVFEHTQRFKKVATAESKGFSAVQELFSRDGQDLDFPGDGRIAWLFYRLSQEADYLTRILLDPELVKKRESIDSNLRTLKLLDSVTLGDRQLIAPSEDKQYKDLQILKTHKGFGYFTATIEKWAAKFASEHPDYDRAFFSPWNKARQSVLNDIRNGGGWRTQWIDRSGERQESKKGQKVKPRKSKGKGFGNL
jgi:hypothetical protein